MKLNLLQSTKSIGRLKLLTGFFLISVFLGGAVLAVHLMLPVGSRSDPAPTASVKEANKSGEVAGVSTENLTSTPSPTPVRNKRTSSPTPTPTPIPNNNSGQTPSNNNQSNNSSASNNTTSQTQGSTPTPEPKITPDSTPTATQTPASEATPTPDNSPFEASWTVSWNGSQASATVGASKPLKRCLYEIWGGSMSLSGDAGASGYGCTIGPGGSPGSNKIWVRAESIYGETKDFGDPNPPSQGNAQI